MGEWTASALAAMLVVVGGCSGSSTTSSQPETVDLPSPSGPEAGSVITPDLVLQHLPAGFQSVGETNRQGGDGRTTSDAYSSSELRFRSGSGEIVTVIVQEVPTKNLGLVEALSASGYTTAEHGDNVLLTRDFEPSRQAILVSESLVVNAIAEWPRELQEQMTLEGLTMLVIELVDSTQ